MPILELAVDSKTGTIFGCSFFTLRIHDYPVETYSPPSNLQRPQPQNHVLNIPPDACANLYLIFIGNTYLTIF